MKNKNRFREESMCILKKVTNRISKAKRATKLFGKEVKSRLKNKFHKRSHAPIAEDMYKDKRFAELGYVPLSDKQVQEVARNRQQFGCCFE